MLFVYFKSITISNLVSILFLKKKNSPVNAISIPIKMQFQTENIFFPISNVDEAEFMKTFFCSFVSYFVCLVFFFRYFWTLLETVSGIIRKQSNRYLLIATKVFQMKHHDKSFYNCISLQLSNG